MGLHKSETCHQALISTVMQVNAELLGHWKILKLFQDASDAEWEGLVAGHRTQLTAQFFDHLESLIHAAHQDEKQRDGTIVFIELVVIIVFI